MSFVYSHPFTGIANGLQTMQGGGAVGGWVELGRTTLGSSNTHIDVTSLSDKRYYMILENGIGLSASVNTQHQLGNSTIDTGSNYANRRSVNGGTDSTFTSDSRFYRNNESTSTPLFGLGYIANLSSNEKLGIRHYVGQNTAGAANAPIRGENVGKWTNTSNPLDRYRFSCQGSDTFGTGSEVVVLGWDSADTHTNNFWEELASVTQSGAGSSLDSGTITAKKYLWIQTFNPDKPSGNNLYFRFNSDSGSNYANRYSTNGGTDVTQTSVGNGVGGNYDPSASGTTAGVFYNTFIINNASNEKLAITHSVSDWTTAGASVAPARWEVAGKWTNTSNQITSVQYNGPASSVSDGTIMKIWGAD